LPKGIGVVMDDVMAGIYAGIILWIISILLGG
jgi:phosphatidylglycerophosphatase A